MATETAPTTACDDVLVVDDEGGVRNLMARWLHLSGYEVREAANADDALSEVRTSPVAVALCDIRMPGRDGLWLAGQLRERSPETAVIMATAFDDVGPAVRSLRNGVVDYLMKPFGRDRLQEAVTRGFSWHRAAVDARRLRHTLELDADERRRELAGVLQALHVEGPEGPDRLVRVLAVREPDVYDHAHRVAALAAAVARELEMPDPDIQVLTRAALLHDVARLLLPARITDKVGALSPEEDEMVRRSPETAYELMRAVPSLAAAAELVRSRHEHHDGSGYPANLQAGDIPLGSRILAVVDSFDTMTVPRPFRPARPAAAALAEVRAGRGVRFDPAVVDAFERVLRSTPVGV